MQDLGAGRQDGMEGNDSLYSPATHSGSGLGPTETDEEGHHHHS